jgi:hypothetical protein
MPRTTKTYDLQEEEERIDEELDRAADEAAEADDGTQVHQKAVARGERLERELAGVQWALYPDEEEDREPYEEVTLGALNAREYGEIGDRVKTAMNKSAGYGSDLTSTDGVAQIFFVAGGLVDAPFIGEEAGFEQKAQAVGDLAPQFATYLQERVDELSTPDVEGNGFAQRVAERESTAPST